MTYNTSRGGDGSQKPDQIFREEAERRVMETQSRILSGLEAPSPDKMRQMLHELRVHQIELEMQNEELRNTQLELDATRARYFDLYDLAPIGYCTLSEQGQIIEANLNAAALLGGTRHELLQQPITRFIFEDDQDLYYLLCKKLLATGKIQTCELRLVKNDGTRFWSHLTVTIVQSSTDAPLLRLMLSDVNERVLLEKQSVQSHKIHGIGQAAGGIAHDFNNSLGIIHGFTELALERVEQYKDAKLLSYLHEVKEASEKALGLVTQLQAFSLGGKVKKSVQSVELAPLINEVVKAVRPLLPRKMEIALMIAPALPNVIIDPAHLHQMAMNLCMNARDVLGSNGRIEIGLAKRVTTNAECASCHQPIQGEFVELWVRDNGCGIPPGTLEHLFEPFYSNESVSKGAGMGLSMVHGLVHSYGGHILVASVPLGTTVRLLLPIAHTADGQLPLAAPKQGAPRSKRQRRAGPKNA